MGQIILIKTIFFYYVANGNNLIAIICNYITVVKSK